MWKFFSCVFVSTANLILTSVRWNCIIHFNGMWCWAGTLLAIRANDTNQAWLCSLWKWKSSFTPINNILSVLIFFHSLLFFVLFESVCFMSVFLHSSKGLQYKQQIYIYISSPRKSILFNWLHASIITINGRSVWTGPASVCMHMEEIVLLDHHSRWLFV